MSTRASIHFKDSDGVAAIVFRHYDGDALREDLEAFFADIEKQSPGDTRFDDATMLAARYVVWQARAYSFTYTDGERKDIWPEAPLAFTGVRVMMEDSPDIEYRWIVTCPDSSGLKRPGRPTIRKQTV